MSIFFGPVKSGLCDVMKREVASVYKIVSSLAFRISARKKTLRPSTRSTRAQILTSVPHVMGLL